MCYTYFDNASLVNEQVIWLEVSVKNAALVAVQDRTVYLVQVALHQRRVHELRNKLKWLSYSTRMGTYS